jgi:hypothetical protein
MVIAGVSALVGTPHVDREDIGILLDILSAVSQEGSHEHVALRTLPALSPLLLCEDRQTRRRIGEIAASLVTRVLEAKEKEELTRDAKANVSLSTSTLPSLPRVTHAPDSHTDISFFKDDAGKRREGEGVRVAIPNLSAKEVEGVFGF